MATYTNWNPSKDNDFITPKSAWEDIIKYIPKDKEISMPFFCEGSCANDMEALGFKVIHQDEDFFKHDKGDCVIDNPPFEIKKNIIETLVERNKPFIIIAFSKVILMKETLVQRNKPFILILPVSTICYKYAKILGDDMQLLIPKKRIKFIHYDKITQTKKADYEKYSASFDCLYVAWRMDLPKDIIFL